MDILAGAGSLLGRRTRQLPAGMIETTRLRDANQQEPNSSVVQSVEFHPAGRLLLTAGLDKRLRLFQVRHCQLITPESDAPLRCCQLAGLDKRLRLFQVKHCQLFIPEQWCTLALLATCCSLPAYHPRTAMQLVHLCVTSNLLLIASLDKRLCLFHMRPLSIPCLDRGAWLPVAHCWR